MKSILWIILILIGLNNLYSIEPKKVWLVNGQEFESNCLKYSQDGKYLFIQSTERENGVKKQIIRQWDIAQKKIVREVENKMVYGEMDVSIDNKLIIGTNTWEIEVVNLEDGNCKKLIPKYKSSGPYFLWISFSMDGTKLFINDLRYVEKIQIYNSSSLDFVGEYLYDDLYKISSSFDKKYGGIVHKSDTTFSVISLDDNQQINKFKIGYFGHWAEIISFSFDNKLVALSYYIGYQSFTEVYEIASGKLIAHSTTDVKYPNTVFTEDNETIGISSYPYSKITLWNYKTDSKTMLEYNLAGSNLSASPIATSLAGTTDEKNFNVIDYQKNEILMKDNRNWENLKQCTNLYISKDSSYILVGGSLRNKGVIQKRDLLTGALIHTYFFNDDPILRMSVSADEKLISITGTKDSVYIVKLIDGKCKMYKGFPLVYDGPLQTIITKDNKKLMCVGDVMGIIYFDIESDTTDKFIEIVFDDYSTSIAINKDNTKLVYGNIYGNLGILEYDNEKDKYKRVFYKRLGNQGQQNPYLSSIGFSPDNSLIFACSGDYNTYVINANDYTKISKYTSVNGAKSDRVSTAAITRDNTKLLVFDNYPSGRIFNLKDSSEIWYDDSIGTHFKVNKASVTSFKLTHNDKYFVTSFSDGSLALVALNDTITSVKDKFTCDDFAIYPNPAKDFITVNLKPSEGSEPSEGSTIHIYNTLGEKVMAVGAENFLPLRIDISDLPTGTYFCKVTTYDSIKTVKFVIIK